MMGWLSRGPRWVTGVAVMYRTMVFSHRVTSRIGTRLPSRPSDTKPATALARREFRLVRISALGSLNCLASPPGVPAGSRQAGTRPRSSYPSFGFAFGLCAAAGAPYRKPLCTRCGFWLVRQWARLSSALSLAPRGAQANASTAGPRGSESAGRRGEGCEVLVTTRARRVTCWR